MIILAKMRNRTCAVRRASFNSNPDNTVLSADGSSPKDVDGQAVITGINDGWGRPIHYRKLSPSTFELRSAGPDGSLNTSDDITQDRQVNHTLQNIEKETRKQQSAIEKATRNLEKAGTSSMPGSPSSESIFPSDIQLYSPAKTIAETSTDNTTMVTATTSSIVLAVYEFYNSQLTRKGWTRTQTGSYAGSRVATFTKGNRTISLVVSTSNKETMIQISHTTE